MSKYKIGDRVAYKRNKSASIHPESWGISFVDDLKAKGNNNRKGVITKIKTHSWFFFKLDNPIYIIDDFYMTCTVKPVKRKYASLREVFNGSEKLESVWELHVN